MLCRRSSLTETHSQTPTLTPLKSESTSESSRLSSSGTFLFFRRCSSRLFWQGVEKKWQNRNEGRGWKCSLEPSEILLSRARRGLPQKIFLPSPNFYFQEFSFHFTNRGGYKFNNRPAETQMSLWRTWTFAFHKICNTSACTHTQHVAMQQCVCVCVQRQQRDPHIPSACRACESVVGGDSPALDSCASCWCASLMTNQPVLCFLQLWSS